jgi:hypothetical protein
MRASRGTYQWPTKPHTNHTLRGGHTHRSERRTMEARHTIFRASYSATSDFPREFYSATGIDPVSTQSKCHKGSRKSPQAPRQQAALTEQTREEAQDERPAQAATKGSGPCKHHPGQRTLPWTPRRGICQAPVTRRKLWGAGPMPNPPRRLIPKRQVPARTKHIHTQPPPRRPTDRPIAAQGTPSGPASSFGSTSRDEHRKQETNTVHPYSYHPAQYRTPATCAVAVSIDAAYQSTRSR